MNDGYKILPTLVFLSLIAIGMVYYYSPLYITASTVGVTTDFPSARVVVTEVIDGDTISISPSVYVRGEYRTIVRLADIDAPAIEAPDNPEDPGVKSKRALTELLGSYGGVVYLDIDKYRGVDEYGRIIAVVYVRLNETHLLNVNKWMIENKYAEVKNFDDNVFDPAKWTLYINYNIASEKLPSITKVTICSNCSINYATSWGVRIATTLDRRYLGLAWADYGDPWALHVRILDSGGNIVNSYDFLPELGPAWYANVFRGMIDIAGNETGFLVVWSNFTYGTYTRVVLYSYIPVQGAPTQPSHIFTASYQYHPTVIYFIHSNGTKWWVVGYGRQTSTASNYTFNLLNLTPSYTGRFFNYVLAGGSTTDLANTPRVGIDVMSGLIYDSVTTNFTLIARVNVTRVTNVQGGPIDHNIMSIVGRSNETLGFTITWTPIDDRPGDQGPEPAIYAAATPTRYWTYYNLYPSIYTSLLSSGRYVLVVYNDTDSRLVYSILDIGASPYAEILANGTIIDRLTRTTYYPWISSNQSHWLLTYSAYGWVNATFITTRPPYLTKSFVIADRDGSYVRSISDPDRRLFTIVYGLLDFNNTRNIYLVLYNSERDTLEPWVIPIATRSDVFETPINIVRFSDGTICIVGLEEVERDGITRYNLVLYYVGPEYIRAIMPDKIRVEPTPSPAPSPTPTPTPSPLPEPSPTPSPSPIPEPSPSPLPEPSPTPTPSPTPSPSPTPTPTPSPLPEPSPTPSPSPIPEPSPSPLPEPSPTPTPSPTPSPSPTPTPTPSPLPEPSPTPSPMPVVTPSPSPAPSPSPSPSPTPLPSLPTEQRAIPSIIIVFGVVIIIGGLLLYFKAKRRS